MNFLDNLKVLLEPEYGALLLSVIAIVSSVYIAWENRNHTFAKEEYFKLQQTAEKITAKLLVLENQKEKIGVYIHGKKQIGDAYIDNNDTLNKTEFNNDSGEIAALIQIYFFPMTEHWNTCLDTMGRLMDLINPPTEQTLAIPHYWEYADSEFQRISADIEGKPSKISKEILTAVLRYKNDNLY